MDYDLLCQKITELKSKYNLTDFTFDAECIYDKGDLSHLIQSIINTTLSGYGIIITEELSEDGQQYIVTLSTRARQMRIVADTFSDWLPDTFFMEMESIPLFFETGLCYYSINPAIGLTGQEAWYFCGTETDLKAARREGLPLIYPGENPTETAEFKNWN
jgi:hypothetical protein